MEKKTMLATAIALVAALSLGVTGCQSPSTDEGGTDGEPPSSQAQAPSTESGKVAAWSEGADCAGCHDDQCAARTAYHESLPCATCHVEDTAFAEAHQGATSANAMPKRLKKTEVSQEVCEGCHGGYGELAAKTQDTDVLTDNKDTTVNPHEVTGLDSPDHAAITCASCHEEHSGTDALASAPALCVTCHHEGTYECGTCHE